MTTLIAGDIITDVNILANKLIRTDWLVDGNIYNLYQRGWIFNLNSKKRALGSCSFNRKEITLSSLLIKYNPDLLLWEDTMKHEISHAIDFHMRGKSDHSLKWKNVGRQVGCSVELLKSSIKVNSVLGKYTLRCKICENEIQIHRKRKRDSACSSCCNNHNNGVYSENFKLQVIQNY